MIHKKKDYIIHEGTEVVCTKDEFFGLHGVIVHYDKKLAKYFVDLRAGGLGARIRVSLDREDFDIIHGVM